MTRHHLATFAAVITLSSASLAQAQAPGGGGSSRPRGFALEVELAGMGNLAAFGDGGLGGGLSVGSWGLVPRLFMGAQLGRFSVGGQASMAVTNVGREGGGDTTYWTMSIGPRFDWELWSSGMGGLILVAALPFRMTARDDDYAAPGFGIDVGIGGRFFLGRWFAMTALIGTALNANFYDDDNNADDDYVIVQWGLYGSLGFRFVAD